VEPDLSRQRARCHIVRPTEGRKKVIQREFVSHVDGGKRKAPFIMIAFEQIIVAHNEIKKATRRDAWRIVVVVLGSIRRHLYKTGTERRRARGRQRSGRGCVDAIAGEPGLELLIGAQGVSENVSQKNGWRPVWD